MAVNQNFKKSTVSTTNHTQNYDLPLWAGEDATSWLTQMNDAMNKIDDGMVDAKSKALEVVGIAADAKKLADETKAESAASAQIVAGYNDRLTAAEEKIVEHTQDITNLNTRSDQFDVELHSVQEVQKKTTADLATLAAKVDTNKSDADTKISANTEAIAKTDANIATVSGKVTALETEVGEVSSATQTNTNAISAINTTIDGIKAKDTEQDGKIAANTSEINSLDGRVTALEDGGSSVKDYQSVKRKSIIFELTAQDVLIRNTTGVTTTHPTINNGKGSLKVFGDGTFYIEIGDIVATEIISTSNMYGFKIFKSDIDALTAEWLAGVLGTSVNVWGKDAIMSNGRVVIAKSGSNYIPAQPVIVDFQLSNKTLIIDIIAGVLTTQFNITDGKLRFFGHLETVGDFN